MTHKGLLALILSIVTSADSAAALKTINVTFKNNSSNTLKCAVFADRQYTPFLRLLPEQAKVITAFTEGTFLHCHHTLASNASTPLTYFRVTESGTYELLMEPVLCGSECPDDIKSRQATIVVTPQGQSSYNKLKSHSN